VLLLLLATCETALDRLSRPDVLVAHELVTDLERVIERTRTELEAFER
jgi:hypothetical protein